MERKTWELHVYKRDLRCKNHERKVKVYTYTNWTQSEMAAEVGVLRQTCYKPKDGWRLEFNAAWVVVRNLMTGADVTIAADAKGTCCDPSQERFWSM